MRDLNEHNPCDDPCCSCCIRFREAWTTGSIYRPGDAVPYNGSSYVAIHWNQNDPPPSANWATIASKGDTGPAGPAGPTGPQGPVGPQGPPGASSLGYAHSFFGIDEVQFGTGGMDFASINLAAGQYVIWATVPITSVDGDPQDWRIEVSATNGAIVLGGSSGRIGPLNGSSTQVVPVLAICDSSTDTTITFRGYGYNIILFPGANGKTCTIVTLPTQII